MLNNISRVPKQGRKAYVKINAKKMFKKRFKQNQILGVKTIAHTTLLPNFNLHLAYIENDFCNL